MRSALALLVAAFLCSCASIVSDSSYTVLVESSPPGADIQIRGKGGTVQYQGKAPMTLSLKASEGFFDAADYVVEASMPGHEKSMTTFGASMDPWFVGNIIFGGLIGFLIVDPATGAMWKLDDRVIVALAPLPSDSTSIPASATVEDSPRP